MRSVTATIRSQFWPRSDMPTRLTERRSYARAYEASTRSKVNLDSP